MLDHLAIGVTDIAASKAFYEKTFGWDTTVQSDTEEFRYRTPVRGLYLTGASTHPGGGVFGASGRTAARVVVRDRRRWR